MDEASEQNPSLLHFKRQRAHKRGQVTKIQKKIHSLDESHPDDWDTVVVEGLSEELSAAISAHDHLQAQINDLLLDDNEAYDLEVSESEKHDELHAELRLTLRRVKQRYQLWSDSNSVVAEIDTLSSVTDKTSSRFRSLFESFSNRCTPFLNAAKYHHSIPAFRDRFDSLRAACDRFCMHTCISDPVPVSTTPSVHHTSCSAPKGAPIPVKVPNFDGNPLHWEKFEAEFSTAIRTRAPHYSNFDVRCLLTDALTPENAKNIITHFPDKDAPLPELLRALKREYGTPVIVGPILIDKLLSPHTFDLNHSGFTGLNEHFIQPFNALVSLIGDSLSTFMAMFAKKYLSPACRMEWEKYTKDLEEVPNMKHLKAFIETWKKVLVPSEFPLVGAPASPMPAHPSFANYPSTSNHRLRPDIKPPHPPAPIRVQSGCPACKDQHGLLRCTTFQVMDVDRQNKLVRDSRLCINCFSDRHGYRSCPNRFSCKTCGGRHHTLLHRDRDSPQQPASPATPVPAMTAATPSTPSSADPISSSNSRFLHTVTVTLENEGNVVKAHAILDTGAAVSMMTEKTASDLKLKRTHNPIQVTGTTGTTHCKFTVSTSLLSHDYAYKSDTMTFTVLPKLPSLQIPSNRQEILSNPALCSYHLADPDLGGRVDLLLNIDDTHSIITSKSFRIDGLLALPTRLGLCLSGPLLHAEPPPALMASVPPTDLQDDLGHLWELDQVPEAPSWSPDDVRVLQEFDCTYRRVDGRFSVSLPRKQDPPILGDTRKQAMCRLLANERSLTAKDKLQAFSAVVREYIDLGHAHVIPREDLHHHPHCYLPVHGVFKDSSSTTKVRAVFDASARSSSSYSFNDCLLPGPNLYPPLQDILLRFRRYPIGMSADISKMFREILLNPEEKNFHRFLMCDQSGAVLDCRMDRLTFGVKCSPFLATQVLHTLARLHASSHPAASSAILHNFYVDDLLSGAHNVEAADALRRELCDLLAQAGMVLRKWRTNSKQLLGLIPEELHDSSSSVSFQPPNHAPKALGIHWDVENDSFHVSVPDILPSQAAVTKSHSISHCRRFRHPGSVCSCHPASKNPLPGDMEALSALGQARS